MASQAIMTTCSNVQSAKAALVELNVNRLYVNTLMQSASVVEEEN